MWEMLDVWLIEFGLPEADFWSTHPTRFRRLYRAFEARENREYARVGTLAATIINVNRSKRSSKVWTAMDVYPHLREAKRQADAKRPGKSPEDIKRILLTYLTGKGEMTRGS